MSTPAPGLGTGRGQSLCLCLHRMFLLKKIDNSPTQLSQLVKGGYLSLPHSAGLITGGGLSCRGARPFLGDGKGHQAAASLGQSHGDCKARDEQR